MTDDERDRLLARIAELEAAQPVLQRQAFLAGAIWMHEEHLHRPLDRDVAAAQAEAERRHGGGV